MSIFSKIRTAKKAAAEHKRKEAAATTTPAPPKVPYKHVPTHAAQDSMNMGGITTHEFREQIREENRRRSRMSPGRTGSDLSIANRATMYRNSNGNSYSNRSSNSMGETSIESVMQHNGGPAYKRHSSHQPPAKQRPYFSHTSMNGIHKKSPLSQSPEESAEEDSPIESSNTSTHTSSSSASLSRLEMNLSSNSKQPAYKQPVRQQLVHQQPVHQQPIQSVPYGVYYADAPPVPELPSIAQQAQAGGVTEATKKRWTFNGKRTSAVPAYAY